MSTAFGKEGYTARRGKATHKDFESYPGNGKNPKHEPKAKLRGDHPEKFTGEADCKIKFGSWVKHIRNRFVSNNTYFKDERERITYAASRLSGRGRRGNRPCFESETHPFVNVAKLIQTLETGFGDVLEKNKAIESLECMFLRVGEEVNSFLITLNGLYETAVHARDQIKEELLRRVDPDIAGNIR